MSRPAPFSLAVRHTVRGSLLLAVVGLLVSGCVSAAHQPPRELAGVWKSYRALSPQRALAIAGDPRRDRWVAGASGGHASSEAAGKEALTRCRQQRALRRMQAQCRLYALDDEVVWPGPR